MYAARPDGADSATIDPAALNPAGLAISSLRGRKRGLSPSLLDSLTPGHEDGESYPSAKRVRSIKAPGPGSIETPGLRSAPNMPPTMPPPQTSPPQDPNMPPQATPTYAAAPVPAAAPPKTTPTKSTIKALPTVRDHTTDQLNEAGDEYLPREIDEFGEKKVMPNGELLGDRQYRCRTFHVPNRGDKLFMLATECARVLGYRDSYLLFNKNRSLFKIIASQTEKDDLVAQEILPFSYRSRQIAIVTARSMFRQFGSRVIENGRRVRDDYWEQKARKQGFTEADAAGEKRPGGAKTREAEAQSHVMLPGAHTEIVYNNNPAAYPGPPQPPLVQADLNDTRPRDFSGIVKGGPRQEITGPPYQDQTRPAPLGEIHAQASHAADYNRSVNHQRDMRGDYLQGMWRRPHEQPSPGLNQTAGSSDSAVATTRPTHSPHTATSGITHQPSAVSSQSPQMMMTAPPYAQSLQAQNAPGQQPPMRAGSTSSIGQGTPSYNYPSGQMWSQPPQTPQQNYSSYTTQSQQQHPPQSPASHLRQPSSGQMQPGMQYPAMAGMQYGTGGSMYSSEQTPRQYMAPSTPGNPQVSQGWSGQQSPPQQWWAPQQQPQ